MPDPRAATVLVVDDNPQNLALVQAQLERAGYRVTTTESGRDALEIAANDPPDLILLDVMMPGLDGYEVCRRFRTGNYAASIPIVMLTSLQEQTDKLRALQAGANDFLSKPVDRAELLARVHSFIHMKQLYDELEEQRRDLELQAHQLAIEKSRAEGILDSMADGVVTVDGAGAVTLFNPGIEQMVGLTFEETRGRPWPAVLNLHTISGQPIDDDSSPIQEVLRTGHSAPARDLTLWRPNQTVMDVSVSAAPIRQAGGAMIGVVCVFRDVSREREAARLRQEFIALVTHEIRTPMAAIYGFAELLITRETLSDKARGFAETIYREADRLSNLINDFLDIHRLESGRMPFHARAIDINELVHESLRALANQAAQHQIVVDAEALLFARADRDRAIQILVNLIGNAIKYSPNGGSIRISAQRRLDRVRIAITDTGVGIPPEAMARLFEKFFRIDSPAHRFIGGTGLGLAICKQMVEAMGGQIWAKSAGLGQGSTFEFTLPIAQSLHEPDPAERPLGVASGRILLVKDDPSLVALILEQLGEVGYVVEAVSTGEEAVARARIDQPAAVILDVGLAGSLDGWDVLALFRSDPALSRIPIVMISGRDDRARGLALGVDDFLVKPVPRNRLIECLRRFVGDGPGEGKSILIADDDPKARQIHGEALQSVGFDVVMAADGADALRSMHQAPPLAVLLDLNMPRMDGFQVLEAMKRDPALARIPVIVVTAQQLEPSEHEALSNGVTALLQKSGGSATDIIGVLRRAVAPVLVPGEPAVR
jgi:PAS domain S-box-containing protein